MRIAPLAAVVLALAAPSLSAAADPSPSAIVAAPDRSADDRALDGGRHPAELLTFIGVQPGWRVADLGTGMGYTAELLARAVGPTGVVYAQNSPFILERFAKAPWAARLEKPVMKPVRRVDAEFDDPLPPEAENLDAVVMVLFYHDTVWMGTDRKHMNERIFEALRPGGVFVVVDHSGREGSGTTETQSLHRIEESALRSEIEAAGFRLLESADFLRNPADPRDWNASPRAAGDKRGTSDRFVLKFAKPAPAS